MLLATFTGCDRKAEPEDAKADESATGEAGAKPPEIHPELLAAEQSLVARDLAGARRHLEAVPEGDPSYHSALLNLAPIYLSMGELELALQTYEKLALLQSRDPRIFIDTSWVQYRLGRLDDAEFSALRAIELASDDPEPRYNVAFFRLAQGRLAEAAEAYLRAMKLDFDSTYYKTARAHLLRLQEERPDFPDVHYALAYFANSLGDRVEEMNELERYLAMDPKGPTVEVARARLADAREALVNAP
jgi:tetratricopeptide (TPR) repeat protein